MTVAQVAEKLNGFTIWRDGNGAPGAEERLRRVEASTEDVKTWKTLSVKMLEDMSADVKKLNRWFFFVMLFLAVLVGDRVITILSLIK